MGLSETLYHLTLVGDHLGNRTQNGFWFGDKLGSLQDHTNESLVKLMNDFNEYVLPPLLQFCSSGWHGVGLVGRVMNVSPFWMISAGYETAVGVQDADSLPADCAAVVAVDGGIAGRSHRGRIYVPAIAKTLTDGDYLSGSGFGLLGDFVNGLSGRFGIAGSSLDHTHCIYSPKLGDLRHVGPPVVVEHRWIGATPAQNYNRRRLVCSQRRRRPDHGV